MATEPYIPQTPEQPASRNPHAFPPGPGENVLWRGVRKRGPVNPLEYFAELTVRFGDIAHYKLGLKHVIFVNNPEYIRDILIVQHQKFVKERTQQRAKMLLLGEGMITSERASHRGQRQVAQPAFHRQRIPGYAAEIVRRTSAMRDTWHDGQKLDAYGEMMHLALGVVGKTLFGTELGEEVRAVNRAVGNIMDVYNAVVLLPAINFLLRIPFTPLRKFVHARQTLDDMVYRLIREHREGLHGDDDLLSMMLASQQQMGWSDRDLRDQVVTVFLAGYETTAIALTWTWYLLAQNPEAERRLHEEVDAVLGGRLPSYDDLPKLKYTEMVMAEALRLYPPAWGMGRLATEDFEIGRWQMPAGTTVVMSQFITHRDARYFPDPLRFDPERFTPEAKAQRARFTYYPFGMGPRQCIGEAFAWMEGVLIIATVAQRWRLRLVPGQQIKPQPLFTLRPKFGMKMVAEKRKEVSGF
ncbi:MAG TPA: cytochrome P450 [Clostridia bacterium]|nr:cytochrome P450 [Clostridia bacterium]